jgi:hypothetical protein
VLAGRALGDRPRAEVGASQRSFGWRLIRDQPTLFGLPGRNGAPNKKTTVGSPARSIQAGLLTHLLPAAFPKGCVLPYLER